MAKRLGSQPGQIGATRFKDIAVTGVPDGWVLVVGAGGRVTAVAPGSVVGTVQLSDLSDVGAALSTPGFILSVSAGKYNGQSPDSAGIINKTTAQTIAALKDFAGGLKTTTITPHSGSVVAMLGRMSGQPAVNLDEYATLSQMSAVGGIVTLGLSTNPKNPDFNTLGDAIESLTTVGGGIILVLDNEDYEATDIDQDTRSMSNIVIWGQPGAAIADMPGIRLVGAADLEEEVGSSSPATSEIPAWHLVGCRLGLFSLDARLSILADDLSIILDECGLTEDDIFSQSAGAGADEGVIVVPGGLTGIRITMKSCRLKDGAFTAFGTKVMAFRSSAPSTSVAWQISNMQEESLDSVLLPASPRELQFTSAAGEVAGALWHDNSVQGQNTNSTSFRTRKQSIPAETLGSRQIDRLKIRYGVTATTIALDAFAGALFAYGNEDSNYHRYLIDTGGLTADISASGVNGRAPGIALAVGWYYLWLVESQEDLTRFMYLTTSATLPSPSAPSGLAPYSLCRRIGSCYWDGATIVEAIQEKELIIYENEATAVSTGDPGANFVAVGTAVRTPPTSSRARLTLHATCGLINNDIFAIVAHGDKAGATGGIRAISITAPGGSGGSDCCAAVDVDLNASRQFAVRREATVGAPVFTALNIFVTGYYESF